jgi:hypothetical protein
LIFIKFNDIKQYKCNLCTSDDKYIKEIPYYFVDKNEYLNYKICMDCAIFNSSEGNWKRIQNLNLYKVQVKPTDINYISIISLMELIKTSDNKKQKLGKFICNKCNIIKETIDINIIDNINVCTQCIYLVKIC